MCLGIPGEVVERETATEPEADLMPHGIVSFGGVRKRVCLAYTPDANAGDYVVVHAGFALSVVDPEEATRIFEDLEAIEALGQVDEIPR